MDGMQRLALVLLFLSAGFAQAQPTGWIVSSDTRFATVAKSLHKQDPDLKLQKLRFAANHFLAIATSAYDQLPDPQYHRYVAFSCDHRGAKCAEIWSGYHFKPIASTRLQKNILPPDILFASSHCTECCPAYTINSFAADPARGWFLRWEPHAGPPIDYVNGEFGGIAVFAIKDFTGDGVDDIGVWLQGETEDPNQEVKIYDSFLIGKVKANGEAEVVEVKEDAQIKKLKTGICAQPTGAKELCEGKRVASAHAHH
jgi:hypothetical protein